MIRPEKARTYRPTDPPNALTAYFCPACGAQITGSYNVDPGRGRCTKMWHRDIPKPVPYVRDRACEWRVIITRPGVNGEGVSYHGDSEVLARSVFHRETLHYIESESSAAVELQRRSIGSWLMEDTR